MIRIQSMDAYWKDIQRMADKLSDKDNAIICMEECGELCQVISKAERNRATDDYSQARMNLIEEMADVMICIDIQRSIHTISDKELEDMIRKKLFRNMQRING